MAASERSAQGLARRYASAATTKLRFASCAAASTDRIASERRCRGRHSRRCLRLREQHVCLFCTEALSWETWFVGLKGSLLLLWGGGHRKLLVKLAEIRQADECGAVFCNDTQWVAVSARL